MKKLLFVIGVVRAQLSNEEFLNNFFFSDNVTTGTYTTPRTAGTTNLACPTPSSTACRDDPFHCCNVNPFYTDWLTGYNMGDTSTSNEKHTRLDVFEATSNVECWRDLCFDARVKNFPGDDQTLIGFLSGYTGLDYSNNPTNDLCYQNCGGKECEDGTDGTDGSCVGSTPCPFNTDLDCINQCKSIPGCYGTNYNSDTDACYHLVKTDRGSSPCRVFKNVEETWAQINSLHYTPNPTTSPTITPTNLPTTSPTDFPTSAPTLPTTSPTATPTSDVQSLNYLYMIDNEALIASGMDPFTECDPEDQITKSHEDITNDASAALESRYCILAIEDYLVSQNISYTKYVSGNYDSSFGGVVGIYRRGHTKWPRDCSYTLISGVLKMHYNIRASGISSSTLLKNHRLVCAGLTDAPSASPTKSPTVGTITPTNNPTTPPTLNPTNVPTKNPSTSPTLNPTNVPTIAPTSNPTQIPTTNNPTTSPTLNPTNVPTKNPTTSPTLNPSSAPTNNPSNNPTTSPTVMPTDITCFNGITDFTETDIDCGGSECPPCVIGKQCNFDTDCETSSHCYSSLGNNSCVLITGSPTNEPSSAPTKNPTNNPTNNPSSAPTKNPTKNPTTNEPTSAPTKNPTTSPTLNPSSAPTNNPTNNPTSAPTNNPTSTPTKDPTSVPTLNPTNNPSTTPTIVPTNAPTVSTTEEEGVGIDIAGGVGGGVALLSLIGCCFCFGGQWRRKSKQKTVRSRFAEEEPLTRVKLNRVDSLYFEA